jgi:alkylation response protein AidB-like acyl-CoA dehydrogenase
MIPRTLFEPEHEQFRDSVRRFLEAEVAPYHAQWEKAGQVDRKVWLKAGELGMLCPNVPEAYGGVGAGYLYHAIVDEEMSRLGLSGPAFSLHSNIVVPYIINHGSEAQKQKYLPACVSGEIITAVAMTEPGAGSDLQGVQTTAVLDGDEYVINGSKAFISNGQLADLVVVVCKTDSQAGAKGLSLILVEAGTPGFEKGTNLEKIGLKAQDTSELFFADVRVPRENILGEEGMGFVYLMQELPQERLSIAFGGVVVMEETLAQTVAYVKERRAFGKSIANFQNTQFKLAELDAEITVMRVFVDRCFELHLQGKLDAVTASKAKLLSSELLCRVADECLQLHGGYGYVWEYPVARTFADARIGRIFGGTSEVMKLIIARELLTGPGK